MSYIIIYEAVSVSHLSGIDPQCQACQACQACIMKYTNHHMERRPKVYWYIAPRRPATRPLSQISVLLEKMNVRGGARGRDKAERLGASSPPTSFGNKARCYIDATVTCARGPKHTNTKHTPVESSMLSGAVELESRLWLRLSVLVRTAQCVSAGT